MSKTLLKKYRSTKVTFIAYIIGFFISIIVTIFKYSTITNTQIIPNSVKIAPIFVFSMYQAISEREYSSPIFLIFTTNTSYIIIKNENEI